MRGNLAPDGAVAKITGKEGERFSGPARVFDSEELMLAALEQGPEAQGVVRVGAHQGRHHGLGFGPDPEGLGAGREALVPRGEEGATVLDGEEGGLERFRRRLGRLGAAAQDVDLRLELGDPALGPPPDAERPHTRAQRQEDGAGGGGEDHAFTGHGRDRRFSPTSGESMRQDRPKPDSPR